MKKTKKTEIDFGRISIVPVRSEDIFNHDKEEKDQTLKDASKKNHQMK